MKIKEIVQYNLGEYYSPYDGTLNHNCFCIVSKTYRVYNYRGGKKSFYFRGESDVKDWLEVRNGENYSFLTPFILRFEYE